MNIGLRAQVSGHLWDEKSTGRPPVSPPPPSPQFVLPSGVGQFWRLRWDEEIPPEFKVRESAYNKNGGTPATRITKEGKFIPMDRDHQEWRVNVVWRNCAPPAWVEEYDETAEDKRADTKFARSFLSFFHSKLAWTNHGHGSDVRAVYPWGLHLKKADGSPNSPMSQQMLGAAGNVVLQVADEYEEHRETWVPCKALRPDELPTWDELLNMPWVMNCSTVQRSKELGENGIHRVNRFPQLTVLPDGPEYDVPLILLSDNGVITFNKNLLSPVDAGKPVPCPYNPTRKFAPPLNYWNA